MHTLNESCLLTEKTFQVLFGSQILHVFLTAKGVIVDVVIWPNVSVYAGKLEGLKHTVGHRFLLSASFSSLNFCVCNGASTRAFARACKVV